MALTDCTLYNVPATVRRHIDHAHYKLLSPQPTQANDSMGNYLWERVVSMLFTENLCTVSPADRQRDLPMT
jgi:hypothetical protein